MYILFIFVRSIIKYIQLEEIKKLIYKIIFIVYIYIRFVFLFNIVFLTIFIIIQRKKI